MKVSDLVGLDRVLGNIGSDLGPDEADRAIADLFGELRNELGEPEPGESDGTDCFTGHPSYDIDKIWGY